MGGRGGAFGLVVSSCAAGCALLTGASDLGVGEDPPVPELPVRVDEDAASSDPDAQAPADDAGEDADDATPKLAPGQARLYAARTAGAPFVVLSRTRLANDTWQPAVTELTMAGAPRFVLPVLSPDALEELLAVQYLEGSDTKVEVHRRTASGWVPEATAVTANAASAARRTFDVEYEASGDALFVYASGSNVPRFRTRANGTWSADAPVPLGGTPSGNVVWIDLVRRPGTDEISLAFVTTAADLHVETWDGTAWDTQTYATLETDLNTIDFNAFAIAYESTSGDLVAVWGRDQPGGAPYVTPWAVRAAGSKTFAATQTMAATPSAAMHAVSEPGTNRIAFVWNEDTCGTDVCDDFYTAIWNGAEFTSVTLVDPNIGPQFKTRPGTRPVGVGWRNGQAVAVYASTNPVTNDLRWTRWTAGAWTAAATAPMTPPLGDQTAYLVENAGEVLGVVVATTTGIYVRAYSGGTTWESSGDGASLFPFGVTLGMPFGVIVR